MTNLAKAEELKQKYGLNFGKHVRLFPINKAEQAVVDEWLAGLKPELMALSPDPLGQDEPYYGAVGGGLTYSFTPTGLGDILTVKETLTGKTLNVTEALDWYFYD